MEQAKAFWSEEDVDQAFDGALAYLSHLRSALKGDTATDEELVQAFRLLESLGCLYPDDPQALDQNQNQDLDQDQDQVSSVVQVLIGSVEALPAGTPPSSSPSSPPPSHSSCLSVAPPAAVEELLPALSDTALEYRQHSCSKACLLGLPSMLQAMPTFWAQNPLKVPLLCGFARLSAMVGGACDQSDTEACDIIYKAPCGQSLRNHDDVMRFLLASESYDVLQVDFFSFNSLVRVDPPPALGPRLPEQDLSGGAEPTPVELCVGEGGARPPDFRYRKERWPHGCFLSRGPALYDACCDCSDGCSDASSCACAAMTTGGRHYLHHRLLEPVTSGLYECGPWCGCVQTRCQNRVVQRGLRVRLQVFQTADRGWGVRCRDDIDAGTFVCIYAGVVLRRVLTPAELPPPKLTRADLPSDDDVEVVTEWLAPPVLEWRSNQLDPPTLTSTPLHVPVIQRPGDAANAAHDHIQIQAVVVGARIETLSRAGVPSPVLERKVAVTTRAAPGVNGTKSLKRAMKVEDMCYIDGSREGNVSRFINHSCQPNLFIQNIFTDSHDAAFPIVAFFTSRAVAAGTELTWNYNTDAHGIAAQTQDVSCLCASDGCRGRFTIEERLCDACEVEGHNAAMN